MKTGILTLVLFTSSALAGEVSSPEFPSLGTPEFNEMYYQKMDVLTVDTRDQQTCWAVADDLRRYGRITQVEFDNFCYEDEDEPLVSIYLMADEKNEVVLRYSDLSEKEQQLVRDTRSLAIVGLAAFVALTLLPPELEGFDDFTWDGAGERWSDNVKAGPEWDDDHWGYNFILHPLWGAHSYGIARHAGFSRGESFLYSVFVSTVLWEYGIEAIEVRPSIQDLIITPVVGSLLGEFFYQKTKEIKQNGGTLYGSPFLGSLALLVMEPGGFLMDTANDLFGYDVFEDAEAYVSTGRNANGNAEIRFGVRFLF